ncbi:TPA: hypothetical protein ACH3X3_006236 [Trebouxia sp. C0006]
MLSLKEISTHESDWDPASLRVTLNARLDARLVPHGSAMRLDYGHVVVLDNFIGEPERQSLIDTLTQPSWDHSQGPPSSSWERETADGQGLSKTWGLKDSVLQELAKGALPAMQEVQTRLAKMYPDYFIAHMPSHLIQTDQQAAPDNHTVQSPQLDRSKQTVVGDGIDSGDSQAESSSSCHMDQEDLTAASGSATAPTAEQHADSTGSNQAASVDCNQFVGNAAVYGDCYTWHIDADPAAFPSSPWVDAFGHYCNGEPGRPLLVSLLLYLDTKWPRQWDAETLFLDDDTDIGIVVRPKCFRAVLMDQDILHRVSTPSQVAGSRPRYSLVWKLVFMPRVAEQQCCIAKASWGPPTALGSAARVESIKRTMLRKRKDSSA